MYTVYFVAVLLILNAWDTKVKSNTPLCVSTGLCWYVGWAEVNLCQFYLGTGKCSEVELQSPYKSSSAATGYEAVSAYFTLVETVSAKLYYCSLFFRRSQFRMMGDYRTDISSNSAASTITF
jgi:hypothetical protein